MALAAAVLWQWKDPSVRRASAFLFFVALAAIALLSFLGTPKPIWAEHGKLGIVVAVEYEVGRAIYIWTRGNPPVSYELPWSEETAEALEEGLRKARQEGQEGVALYAIEYGEYVVHPTPQEDVPYKEEP